MTAPLFSHTVFYLFQMSYYFSMEPQSSWCIMASLAVCVPDA